MLHRHITRIGIAKLKKIVQVRSLVVAKVATTYPTIRLVSKVFRRVSAQIFVFKQLQVNVRFKSRTVAIVVHFHFEHAICH